VTVALTVSFKLANFYHLFNVSIETCLMFQLKWTGDVLLLALLFEFGGCQVAEMFSFLHRYHVIIGFGFCCVFKIPDS